MKKEQQFSLEEHANSYEGYISIDDQLKTIESMIDVQYLSNEQKRLVVEQLNIDLEAVIQDQTNDQFGIVRGVWSDMAKITAAPKYDTEGYFSREQMVALKLYSAGLFKKLESIEQKRPLTVQERESVYQAYFASSDQITEYTGGYASKLELFALSRRSLVGRELSGSLMSGLIYDGTFSDISGSLDIMWKAQNGVEKQLTAIASLGNLLKASEREVYPTDRMQRSIHNKLRDIADDVDTAPFTRIYASRELGEAISRKADNKWVFLDELPMDEQERLIEQYEEQQNQAKQEQLILHDNFPEFSDKSYLYRIARDACVQIEQGDLGRLITTDGREGNLHRPDARQAGLGMSTRDIELLKRAHNQEVLETIELESGLDMRMLPLDAQVKFFRFMAESRGEGYDRFCSVIGRMGDEQMDFAEAFLATEFGDDFGEAILDIAENATAEQSTKIFETVNSLRHRSREYSEMFASIDLAFAKQTEQALNERTTDMLVALQEVAVKGSLDEDVSPARNTPGHESNGDFDINISSLDEAIEIFGNLDKTFAKQQEILQAEDLQISHVNEDSSQFTSYRFSSKTEGNMLLYARPEGAYGYDRAVEYGNHAGVEASMSFVVDPVNPYKLLLPKSADGVSIRFDREGRGVGEAPNSPDRDPTRQDGMVSIDVSSIIGLADSMPVKIGRTVAAGNLIRSKREGTADSLHHNANYFDQSKYGSAVGFDGLVRKLIQQVEMLRRSKAQRRMVKQVFDRVA